MTSNPTYLFRHALLRDAAYQLQLPGARARTHGLAFDAIESLCGGRPPEPPPLDRFRAPSPAPHAADAFAEELARYAAGAGEDGVRSLGRGRIDEARGAWRRGAAEIRRLGEDHELQEQTRTMRDACAKAGVPPLDGSPG